MKNVENDLDITKAQLTQAEIDSILTVSYTTKNGKVGTFIPQDVTIIEEDGWTNINKDGTFEVGELTLIKHQDKHLNVVKGNVTPYASFPSSLQPQNNTPPILHHLREDARKTLKPSKRLKSFSKTQQNTQTIYRDTLDEEDLLFMQQNLDQFDDYVPPIIEDDITPASTPNPNPSSPTQAPTNTMLLLCTPPRPSINSPSSLTNTPKSPTHVQNKIEDTTTLPKTSLEQKSTTLPPSTSPNSTSPLEEVKTRKSRNRDETLPALTAKERREREKEKEVTRNLQPILDSISESTN